MCLIRRLHYWWPVGAARMHRCNATPSLPCRTTPLLTQLSTGNFVPDLRSLDRAAGFVVMCCALRIVYLGFIIEGAGGTRGLLGACPRRLERAGCDACLPRPVRLVRLAAACCSGAHPGRRRPSSRRFLGAYRALGNEVKASGDGDTALLLHLWPDAIFRDLAYRWCSPFRRGCSALRVWGIAGRRLWCSAVCQHRCGRPRGSRRAARRPSWLQPTRHRLLSGRDDPS